MRGGGGGVVRGGGVTGPLPLAVIMKHGKDCDALAMALEGKTTAQCRNFFTNYKRKLNLPRFIAEYEIKNVSMGGARSGWLWEGHRSGWLWRMKGHM